MCGIFISFGKFVIDISSTLYHKFLCQYVITMKITSVFELDSNRTDDKPRVI